MKTTILAGLASACLIASGLSGCALLNAKPADLAPAIDALGRAGCTFNFSISGGAGTASGLSMGAGHAENTFTGGCNPALAHPAEPAPPIVVPLSQIGSVLPPAVAAPPK